MIRTIADLIRKLGGPAKAAEALGLDAATTVSSWASRGSIPVEHWPKLIAAAAERGIDGVTYEKLVTLHTSAKAARVAS